MCQKQFRMSTAARPAYLRLGRDEKPEAFVLPEYAAWRRILSGESATVLAVGPLVGGLLAAALALPQPERPSLWVLSELPIVAGDIPPAFIADFRQSGHLVVVEEHVAQGSAGASLAAALLVAQALPTRFTHRCALGYPSGCYGSQSYHRQESGLDPASILSAATKTK